MDTRYFRRFGSRKFRSRSFFVVVGWDDDCGDVVVTRVEMNVVDSELVVVDDGSHDVERLGLTVAFGLGFVGSESAAGFDDTDSVVVVVVVVVGRDNNLAGCSDWLMKTVETAHYFVHSTDLMTFETDC